MSATYKKIRDWNTRITVLVVAFFSFGHPLAIAKETTGDKIKNVIQEAADSLKKGVEAAGEDLEAIQSYLDNYQWKGLLEHEATSEYATLRDLKLNHRGRAIVVSPGERIHGKVHVTLDANQCSPLSLYRIAIGFSGKGAQTTIYNSLGACKDHAERFDLIAPQEPGIYQIRFRLSNALFESSALDEWVNKNGDEPDAKSTIGIVVVK